MRRSLAPFGYLSPTIVLILVLMVTPIVMVIVCSMLDNVIGEQSPSFVGKDSFAAILAVLWRMLLAPDGAVNHLLGSTGLLDQNIEWLSGPRTALVAVIFINVWSGYPFYMMSLLAGLQGIPGELYEAATVDGAGLRQRFFFVTLPQLRPLLVSLALLDVIWTTQQFPLIWMTTGGGPINATEVLSTYTHKLAFSRYEFSMASASAVIVLAVSMVLAVLYARAQRARD